MRFYIDVKEGPNKGSSFLIKLEREFYNFYNGDNSKIIFYGGIRNDERLFEDVIRERRGRP